jgi:thioredoxin 2
MSSIVRCHHCGQANRVPEGRRANCGKCRQPLPEEGRPVKVDDSSFSELVKSGAPVLTDFWAPWCGPCRTIAPVLEEVARKRPDVVIAKLNVDENPNTSGRFSIQGIPTLIFFHKGAESGRIVGAVGRQQIEQAIDRYFPQLV